MTTLVHPFLNGSSSFVQITRVTNKAWISLNFDQIASPSSFLQITRTAIKSWTGLKFRKIKPGPAEMAALERLKKLSKTYNAINVVTTQSPPSFLTELLHSCR